MLQQTKNHHIYQQQLQIITFGFLIIIINGNTIRAQGSIPRSPEYRDGGGGEIFAPRSTTLNSHEPSCEQLKAMWRFSKRQSRAAEITNEIPTYRDPFTYNIWEPYYPTTRSIGGRLRINSRYRDATRPVFGRILHKAPPLVRLVDKPRLYSIENKTYEPRRRQVQFRFAGTGGSVSNGIMPSVGVSGNIGNVGIIGGGSGSGSLQNALTPQKGSFQRLKELVWTERARELSQQRKAEETAARASVLKEISNGNGYGSTRHQNPQIVRGGFDTEVLPPSSSLSISREHIISEYETPFTGHSSISQSSGAGGLSQPPPLLSDELLKHSNQRYDANAWQTALLSTVPRSILRERKYLKLRDYEPKMTDSAPRPEQLYSNHERVAYQNEVNRGRLYENLQI